MGTVQETNQPVVLKYYTNKTWEYVAKIEVKIEQTLKGGPHI